LAAKQKTAAARRNGALAANSSISVHPALINKWCYEDGRDDHGQRLNMVAKYHRWLTSLGN